MTTHDAAVTLVTGSQTVKGNLRAALVRRYPYIVADDEDPQQLTALDAVTGAAIVDILYKGKLFHYDAADLTSPHDDFSCLVSAEGRRYKVESALVFVFSVISYSEEDPPSDPELGDAYLVPTAATGDWVGHDDEVAVYTARGWEFDDPAIGRAVYVIDEDGYYRRKSDGTWSLGFGRQTLLASSVPLSILIAGKPTYIVKVEDQTTNAPPASPTIGDAYIIGSSPSGDWAGNAKKLAVCEEEDEFTIYDVADGDEVFDKDLAIPVRYDAASGEWRSAGGSIVARTHAESDSGSTTAPSGTNYYSYSSGTAPTTNHSRRIDADAVVSHAARATGRSLIFRYVADITLAQTLSVGATDGDPVFALYRDSEVNAIAWCRAPFMKQLFVNDVFGTGEGELASVQLHVELTFHVAANNTSDHDYKVAALSWRPDSSSIMDCSAMARRRLTVEEAGS